MKKLIVVGLLTLILYKAVEPLVYSVIIYSAKISIAHNIQKVLDHYNDETQNDQVSGTTSKNNEILNSIKLNEKQNISFSLALNGNRITTKLVDQYNEYIKKLLKQQTENSKTPTIAILDLISKFICPSYVINMETYESLASNPIWLYLETSIPHIKSIPVPPPQYIPV